jgi:hypothetical protein
MILPTSNESTRQSKSLARLRERYRLILDRPESTDREIDAVRQHVIRIAQTICEHVWGKKLY